MKKYGVVVIQANALLVSGATGDRPGRTGFPAPYAVAHGGRFDVRLPGAGFSKIGMELLGDLAEEGPTHSPGRDNGAAN